MTNRKAAIVLAIASLSGSVPAVAQHEHGGRSDGGNGNYNRPDMGRNENRGGNQYRPEPRNDGPRRNYDDHRDNRRGHGLFGGWYLERQRYAVPYNYGYGNYGYDNYGYDNYGYDNYDNGAYGSINSQYGEVVESADGQLFCRRPALRPVPPEDACYADRYGQTHLVVPRR